MPAITTPCTVLSDEIVLHLQRFVTILVNDERTLGQAVAALSQGEAKWRISSMARTETRCSLVLDFIEATSS